MRLLSGEEPTICLFRKENDALSPLSPNFILLIRYCGLIVFYDRTYNVEVVALKL